MCWARWAVTEVAPRPRGPCETSPQSSHTRFHARAPHGTGKGAPRRKGKRPRRLDDRGLLRGPERGMRNFGRTRSKFAPFWVIRLVFSSFLYTRVNTRHCGGSAVPDFATATPVSGVCGGRRSREPATAREARRAGARERVRQLGLSWRGIGGPHNSDATAGKSAPTAANLTP